MIIGGGLNKYDGNHYGEIIAATVQAAVPKNYRWYDNDAVKKEASLYTKWTEKLTSNWQTFLDLQVRAVNYSIDGFRDNPSLKVDNDYFFFNPKAGLTYTKNKIKAYVSFSHAAKEPNRDDFEAGATQQPKSEKLYDYEAGIERKTSKNSFGLNLFYMDYTNQLVLTGQINDVGAYTRTNIPKSYRAGIELEGKGMINKYISAGANIAFSKNEVKNFTEFIDDYDNGGQQTKFYKKADIAFSPDVVASATINIIPLKNAEINLVGKYVSRQYLDNTSQDSRSLKGYYTQDIRAAYNIKNNKINDIKLFVQVNNLFSKKYEPNGYTFSYIYGGSLTTENYYFPMAPINFMAGINLSF